MLVVLTLGSIAPAAKADTVAIQNASFETTNPLNFGCGSGCSFNLGPIPGWTTTGQSGSFQPSSTYFALPLPDGNIVAYSNGGSISQTLAASLTPDTIYTLSVDVGNRLDGEVTDYSIALYVDGTLLSSLSSSNGVIPAGTFADETVTYTSGAVVPAGNLSIVLTSGGVQADFDNVRLTASTVPEPSSLSLLAAALGLMVLVFRRP